MTPYLIGYTLRSFARMTPMPAPVRWISDFDYGGFKFACGAHIRTISLEFVNKAASDLEVLDECERLLQDIKLTIATYEY